MSTPAPASPRIDAATVRATLRAAGLRARRSLSQNFLVDAEVLEAIVDAADPAPGRRVLEIGPGLGILTGALLAAGADVVAVELDDGLVGWLRKRYAAELASGGAQPADGAGPADEAGLAAPPAGRTRGASPSGALRLVHGDILDEDVADLVAPPFDVVANLPYHVTSPVLHRLLGASARPDRMVLMVQREVAERIAAPPGGASYLSIFVQYHARVRVLRIVPATAFEPAPKVESAVIAVAPWRPSDQDAPRRLPPDEEDALWRVVQAAFRERRKMLHNVLARQLPIPSERVDAALAAGGIAPDRRPQTLAVAEWIQLTEALGPIGPDRRGRRESRQEREAG